MTAIEDVYSLGNVSREARGRLKALESAVLRWTPHINLIAASQSASIWSRHILDSAQIYRHAPPAFKTWTDLGSGAGFPGLVAAILAADVNPCAHFSLIESDQRKAAFLVAVANELDLEIEVLPTRIEQTPPQVASVVSARALAPLDRLLPLVSRHLSPDGIVLLPKGRQIDKEISIAKKTWSFSFQKEPSIGSETGTILIIRDLSLAKPSN